MIARCLIAAAAIIAFITIFIIPVSFYVVMLLIELDKKAQTDEQEDTGVGQSED